MHRMGARHGLLATLTATALLAACGGTSTPVSTAAPGGSAVSTVAEEATTPPTTPPTTRPTTVAPTSSVAPPSSVETAAIPQDYSERGPFAVGVTELHLDHGRPVLVFYPVDRTSVSADAVGFGYTAEEMWGTASDVWPIGWALDVPDAWVDAPVSASGPYPLVVFSHGWGNTRFSNSLHTAHLASWGFVVAVPEHASRDITARLAGQDTLPPSDPRTIAETIALMDAYNSLGGGSLAGAVDVSRVAVEGYSAGGRDAALAAALPEVDTWISVAGTPPVPDDAVAVGELFAPVAGFDLGEHLAGITPPDKPSMLLVAGADSVVLPSYSDTVFAWLGSPKRLVVLGNTGHVVFTDGCRLYQEGLVPGLVDVFAMDPASVSVQIGDNGCRPEYAPAQDVAAVWNHVATAQLAWVFGMDADVAAASLELGYLEATFPGRVQDDRVE